MRSDTVIRIAVAVGALVPTGCDRISPESVRGPEATPLRRTSTGQYPNIVFIFTDDQAPGTLGCEGNPHVRTPRLDRLAEQGAYFSRAYVPTPQCAPSRAAVLTGLYPHLNGVRSNIDFDLDPDTVTFSELFKQKGYACGLVGKWHLGGAERPQFGFEDAWAAYQGPMQAYDPRLWVNGKQKDHRGYLTDVLTDHAIRFVEEHAHRPFLLWLAYKAPHEDFDPPPDPRFAHDPARLPLPESIADDLSGKPPAQRASFAHKRFVNYTPRQIQGFLSAYYAMISCVDHNVGRLLDRLTELKLERDTLVIYMSDNGYLFGEHRLFAKGPAFYEELVRSPMIMYWPGRITPGTRVDSLVSSLDIFPTLCRLAGISTPEGLSGHDLWPMLSGDSPPVRDAVFLEYHAERRTNRTIPMRGLVTSRYKYVRYLYGPEELYDLRTDPHEMRNVIGEGNYLGVANSLREKLSRWRTEARDVPGVNPR